MYKSYIENLIERKLNMNELTTILLVGIDIVFVMTLLISIKILLEKKKDKKISIILPIVLFIVSIIAITQISVSGTKTIELFMIMNIPTVISIIVVYLSRKR